MITALRPAAAVMSVLVAAGCQQVPNPPLIFGQTHTVGITIAGSPAQQGGEFTFGYRDRNLALIPVTVTQGDGTVTQLDAVVDGDDKDAFSVLGQFEVDTAGTEAKVGLGKFFATGLAARRLGDGFACALSEGTDGSCTAQGDSSNP